MKPREAKPEVSLSSEQSAENVVEGANQRAEILN